MQSRSEDRSMWSITTRHLTTSACVSMTAVSYTHLDVYKRQEYGTPEKIEDIYDYRAKLKQKFYFYQDMSKDDDVPKKLQNDFLHQMYEDFGTIEEDCFYDRLEDGKYDEGFKERQVKEEKSR